MAHLHQPDKSEGLSVLLLVSQQGELLAKLGHHRVGEAWEGQVGMFWGRGMAEWQILGCRDWEVGLGPSSYAGSKTLAALVCSNLHLHATKGGLLQE